MHSICVLDLSTYRPTDFGLVLLDHDHDDPPAGPITLLIGWTPCWSANVLGPVPGVGVMAKRYQGLLNAGDSFPRALGCLRGQRSSAGVAREGAFFFARLQGGALGGPGPVWVQLGPPQPPREGAVPDSPVQNKMTRIALAGGRWIQNKLLDWS
jgi:hypothetical protein